MPLVVTVFVVLALICFLVGTINVQLPGARPIDWTCAGLLLLVLAYLVRI